MVKPEEQIFLDQDESAEFVTLSPRTMEKKRFDGDGPPYIKIGSRVLYEKSDLIAWVRSHRRHSTSEAAG